MKTYTARVIEQQGSSSRTGTFLLDVDDALSDATAMSIASGQLETEDLDIEWGSWVDNSMSAIYVAGVTEIQAPKLTTYHVELPILATEIRTAYAELELPEGLSDAEVLELARADWNLNGWEDEYTTHIGSDLLSGHPEIVNPPQPSVIRKETA